MEYIKNIEYELKKYKNIDQKNIKLNLKELKKHIRNHNKIMKGKGLMSSCLRDPENSTNGRSCAYNVSSRLNRVSPLFNPEFLLITFGTVYDLKSSITLKRYDKASFKYLSYETSEIIDLLIYIYEEYTELHNSTFELSQTFKDDSLKVLSVLYHIYTKLLDPVFISKQNAYNLIQLYIQYISFIKYAFEQLIKINNKKFGSKLDKAKSELGVHSRKRTSAASRKGKKNEELQYNIEILEILLRHFELKLKPNLEHESISNIDSLFDTNQLKTTLQSKKDENILLSKVNFDYQEEMLEESSKIKSKAENFIRQQARSSRKIVNKL